MFLKKKLRYILLSLILFLVGCSSSMGQMSPPELNAPASQRVDLATVTRGTLEQIRLYYGIVRVSSDQLHFGVTPLRFDEFHVMVGDEVVQGQLLARLNVEHIEDQIEDLLEVISQTGEAHQFENNIAGIEISILEAERGELIAQEEEDVLIASKTLDINQRHLELAHAREWQALTMRDLNNRLEELNEQLIEGELLAPYDGTITWLANMTFGDGLYPFQTIVCITNHQDVFIEYAATGHLAFSLVGELTVSAMIGDRAYPLKARVLCEDEVSRYILNEMVPPSRFDVIDQNVRLTPGVPVIIRHYNNIALNTLMVPVNTVYSLFNYPYVYVNNNGSRELRYIETGIRNRAFIEVLSGLEEGEEVFVQR
jgi:multidrug efflux pump subunit AcrA (membrane-fusion protein)